MGEPQIKGPVNTPWSYGQMMLDEYPGFKNSPAFKNGFEVRDATPERQQTEYGKSRYSEWYFPGEPGGKDEDMLPNPGNSKRAVLEIYNQKVLNDPDLKKELVLGEMLHGAKEDPYYASLRKQFADSFTPQEVERQTKNMSNEESDFYAYPGESRKQMLERSGIDAYLRGYFMPNVDDPGWVKAYSPKQKDIADKMMNYFKTGEQMSDQQPRVKPFTDQYPQWDEPTFRPEGSYITPKKDTANRSMMSRIYESVLDSFSDARQKMLNAALQRPSVIPDSPRPQVIGTMGTALEDKKPSTNGPSPTVLGTNGLISSRPDNMPILRPTSPIEQVLGSNGLTG